MRKGKGKQNRKKYKGRKIERKRDGYGKKVP